MDFGSFLSDIGRNIGNFFGGGNKEEEDRKRRQQPQQVVQPQQPAPLSFDRSAGTVQPPRSYAPPKLGGVERDEFQGLSDNDRKIAQKFKSEGKQYQGFVDAARGEAKAKANQYDPNNIFNVGKEVVDATAEIAVQPLLSIPERATRSLFLEPLAGNATRRPENAISTASNENTGIREFLYGKEPVRSYQEEARNAQLAAEASDNDFIRRIAPLSPFLAPLLAGLDVLPPEALLARGLKPAQREAGALTSLADDATRGVTKTGRNAETPVELPRTPTPEAPRPRDPNSPITVSPPSEKPPAISTPNAPVRVPTEPIVQGGIPTQQPTILPEQPPLVPKQQLEVVQKILDEQSATPVPDPVPAEVVPIASPRQVETQVIAENPIPISPDDVARAEAKAIEAQAPTDTPVPKEGTVTPDTGKVGTIARDFIADRTAVKSDDTWEVKSNELAQAIEKEAEDIGTTFEKISAKVQKAYDNKATTYKEAGLTDVETDLYTRVLSEMNFLRNRADPSMIKGGTINKFYLPRQEEDTVFTKDLVNELRRDRNSPITAREADLSVKPVADYIRRYGDAPNAMTQHLKDRLGNVKDANGNIVETGVTMSKETERRVRKDLDKFTKALDEVVAKSVEGSSVKDIRKASDEADKAVNEAFDNLIKSLPNKTPLEKLALDELKGLRGTYIQNYVRSNMLLGVNRVFDQVQKADVVATNRLLPIIDKVTSKMLNTNKVTSSSKGARAAVREVTRGTGLRAIRQDYRANMSLAGDSKLSRAGRGYNAGATAFTSLGDLTQENARLVNGIFAARAEAEGIKGKKAITDYLLEQQQTPEFLEMANAVSNMTAPYIGLPRSAHGHLGGRGAIEKTGAAIDNFASKVLDATPVLKKLPPELKRNINDLITKPLNGFVGVTLRQTAGNSQQLGPGLNRLLVGVPNAVRAKRLIKSGDPNSQEVGQLLLNRSIIDGLQGSAALGAIGTGFVLADNWTGSWPDDRKEAARWEREGISSNSFRFETTNEKGEKSYVQIQPGRLLGVGALPVVLPAVIRKAIEDGTDPADAIGQAIDGTIGQLMENLGAESVVDTTKNVAILLSGKDYERKRAAEDFARTAGYAGGTLIPASSALRSTASIGDKSKRDTSENVVVDTIKKGIPGVRQTLPEKLDNLGQPVKNNQVLGTSVVTAGSDVTEDGATVDPIDTEIRRLSDLDYEVTPANDVKNTNSIDDAKLLLETGSYKNATDERRAEMLHTALLGTKTKDISPSLAPELRSALIEYTLKKSDERDVWLEDNDNNLNYLTGKYENAQANDTLSADDKDMNKTGSLIQQLTAAKVDAQNNIPQELTQLFNNTNKSDFKNLSEEDKARIIAYDEARVAAGLPSKFQNKYGGYGSGGSGRKQKFGFAQIPQSLLGVEGNASSGYADNSPLFKPIAELKAPTTANIPKGRTISVKKGFQL